MKALLDEHLSPQIAAVLRDAGFDVLAVADREDLVACSDRLVVETATAEGRAVILLPSARTRTRAAVHTLAAAVGAVLSAHPQGIACSEQWIGPPPSWTTQMAAVRVTAGWVGSGGRAGIGSATPARTSNFPLRNRCPSNTFISAPRWGPTCLFGIPPQLV